MDIPHVQVDFDRDGYAILPGFLTGKALDGVCEALDRFIATTLPTLPPEHVFYEDKSRPETLKQIQRLFEYDDYFHGLMVDSPFQAVAEAMLKGPVVPKNMQYFNKAPGAGQPTPPHQDGFYFNLEPCEAVTLWFALDDVDEENGCVRYVRGSHRAGVLPHNRTQTLGFSQGLADTSPCDNMESMVPCHAQPGDLLGHHALTIHWAEGNRSATRQRRALGFIYYGVHAQEDTARHEAYQIELAKSMRQRGKI